MTEPDARAALTAAQRAAFAADGFLVLPGFVAPAACDALRARADALVAGFDPGPTRSIFTTDEQARRTDDYFLDSADGVGFFFEEEAFDAAGALRGPLARSINKIGHAMHDLVPEFQRFTYTSDLAGAVADIGLTDALALQELAQEEGIPYQTLMSSILHKYVTGRLVERPRTIPHTMEHAVREERESYDD